MLRESDHVILVSDTEGQASLILQDVIRELTENDDLRRDFQIKGFLRETMTEIVVEIEDGYQFRMVAKGAEQRVRGIKWRGKRPNLIIMDDGEGDEQVESKDRRDKLSRWLFNVLIPAGSARCRVRLIGTVMHFDSLLYRLLHDPNWVGVLFRAYSDKFVDILWEDRWPRVRLQELRKVFAKQNNLAGFSREYLNEPIDEGDSYFRKAWFKYYADLPENLTYYVVTDFAVSTKESADYTVFIVVGINEENRWFIVDVKRERMDSTEIIDGIFDLHAQYDPMGVLVEDQVIWKSMSPVLNTECLVRGRFPRIVTVSTAGKDKQVRARAFQQRLRTGGVYMDRTAAWHDDLFFELVQFPRGPKDDQVDALSHLGMYLESITHVPESPDGEPFSIGGVEG
ncbi:MAG: phage terminase large subunit, partial [Bacteroidota bacterium]